MVKGIESRASDEGQAVALMDCAVFRILEDLVGVDEDRLVLLGEREREEEEGYDIG